MMTSSNGNIFRVTVTLCGEFTGPGEFPHKGQWRGALMFSFISDWINGWVNNREAGDLRRHRGHYYVNVMMEECETWTLAGTLMRSTSLLHLPGHHFTHHWSGLLGSTQPPDSPPAECYLWTSLSKFGKNSCMNTAEVLISHRHDNVSGYLFPPSLQNINNWTQSPVISHQMNK